MIHLDAPTVFVQWAAGLMVCLALVDARLEVAFGHAWVLRTMALVLGAISVALAVVTDWVWTRDLLTVALVLAVAIALAESIIAEHSGERHFDGAAAVIGMIAVIVAANNAGGPTALAIARTFVGAVFLGGLTGAMVFGHRLLAKPHLGRKPLELATTGVLIIWPIEVVLLLIPTGMVSVFTGTIDDGYAGILGWMWGLSALATGCLLVMAQVILRDKQRSVVAAATGMLYLATLTGFGTDLLARAVLSG